MRAGGRACGCVSVCFCDLPPAVDSEIQLRFPRKKVGVIIGKAGVNIKIIEGKSRAKVRERGIEGG